jgi:secondary thiamine-phosphate synthase enzyme
LHAMTVETEAAMQAVDVTAKVQTALKSMGLISGALLVYSPHTTAGVTVNEHADPTVMQDLRSVFARLVPPRQDFRHAEGNSHAHALASLTGSSVLVPVENGALCLGTWQGIFLLEFDGPRRRKLLLQPLGAAVAPK